MGERSRAVRRVLRLSEGSTTIEGIVAMGVFFLLIALVVQLGFLVIARTAVSASLEGAARRSALPGVDVASQNQRLIAEIDAVAPGVRVVDTAVERTAEQVTVRATVDWIPPGPDLVPVRFSLARTHALTVPP